MILRKFFFKRNKQATQIYSYQKFINKKQSQHQLKAQLTIMLEGNTEKADRLIAKARFADPGKSETYYYYKAMVNFKKSKNNVDDR